MTGRTQDCAVLESHGSRRVGGIGIQGRIVELIRFRSHQGLCSGVVEVYRMRPGQVILCIPRPMAVEAHLILVIQGAQKGRIFVGVHIVAASATEAGHGAGTGKIRIQRFIGAGRDIQMRSCPAMGCLIPGTPDRSCKRAEGIGHVCQGKRFPLSQRHTGPMAVKTGIGVSCRAQCHMHGVAVTTGIPIGRIMRWINGFCNTSSTEVQQ